MELQVHQIPRVVVSLVQIRIIRRIYVVIEIKYHPITVRRTDSSLIESSNDIVLDGGSTILRQIGIAIQIVARIEKKRTSAASLGSPGGPFAGSIGIAFQMKLWIELPVKLSIEYA